jgi:hypothetical protein
MGSFNPPNDAFDDADLEDLEQASQAILTTLVAHMPAGAVAAHDALKLQVRATVYALACLSGDTNPEILRSRILEALPLNSFSQCVLGDGRRQRAH